MANLVASVNTNDSFHVTQTHLSHVEIRHQVTTYFSKACSMLYAIIYLIILLVVVFTYQQCWA